MPLKTSISALRAFMPLYGSAAACAAWPWYLMMTSRQASAMPDPSTVGQTASIVPGCAPIAASSPSKMPAWAMKILPPIASSAGVPNRETVPAHFSRDFRQADRRADAGNRDQVVSAAVTKSGERIVLGQVTNVPTLAGASCCHEGGRQIGRSAL